MSDAPEMGVVGPIPVQDGKSIEESMVPAHLLPPLPAPRREPGELPSQSWPQEMTWKRELVVWPYNGLTLVRLGLLLYCFGFGFSV